MSSTVHYQLNRNIRLTVSDGQEITPKTVIGRITPAFSGKSIPLSSILSVPPSKMTRFLKVGIGEDVRLGQTVAVKKNLFSKTIFKSPYSGKISEINLKTGEMIISQDRSGEESDLTLPLHGKVRSVSGDKLELSVEGTVLSGLKGGGEAVWGKMVYFPKENLEILDRFDGVDRSIVCCNRLDEETSLKLEVIGAKGLVVKEMPKKTNLPLIYVDDEVFRKITAVRDRKILLLPHIPEVVIYD